MDELELELKQGFLEESSQLLDDAEQAFLDLESNSDDSSILDQIFRLAHNLKGTSRAVGFGEVAEFTHSFENLILKLKEGEIAVSNEIVSVLLESNDHVRMMIDGLTDDLDATFDSTDLINKINSYIDGTAVASSENITEETSTDETINATDDIENSNDDNFISASDVALLQEEETKQDIELAPAAFIESSDSVNSQTEQAPAIVAQQQPTPSIKEEASTKKDNKTKVQIDESIRVSLSRLEKLNDFVGELVILQSVITQYATNISSPTLSKSLTQLGKLSKEIHHISMSLRMIPVKSTIQKMQRIVRDTSKTLNKKVNLKIFGEETEVDKTVLEKLNDPLVHIIRNAVDHCIESPEDRLAAGKDEAGNVDLKCMHEGNNLVITVIDDGKGIDPNIIRKKAIEKKVLRPESNMSDEDVIQLIFHPGFSTKEQVSEVSGRGVGMDVVKTNIEELSGKVNLKSTLGKGSVFRIELPLTMAVIDGMITQVGSERFVFPLSQIHETIRPHKDNINYSKGTGDVLNLRGETLPLHSVSNILKIKDNDSTPEDQIAIIVRSSGSSYAVLVDEIHNQQQVVIKNLGAEIKNQKGFMGSSILGDGLPAIILDLHNLVDEPKKTIGAA